MSGVFQRKEHTDAIIDLLSKDKWCAVVAPRFSGKTTFARQLCQSIASEHTSWKLVHIEFSSVLTIEAAGEQIAESLITYGTSSRHCSNKLSISTMLEKLLRDSQDGTLCLILDGLDILPGQVLRLIAGEFRSLYEYRRAERGRSRLLLVFLGALELQYLTAGALSPLSNVLEPFELPDLTREQTAELFCSRLKIDSLNYDNTSILYDETAGHPYLVSILTKSFPCEWNAIRGKDLSRVASDWSKACADLGSSVDECFKEIIQYLENHKQAFDVAVSLLDDGITYKASQLTDDQVMICGAFLQKTGPYAFRGRMLQRALQNYLDDLRKADYYCLHGNWVRAKHYYVQVLPEQILERRRSGIGISRRRIMDMYLSLIPMCTRMKTLNEAENFVCDTGLYLFGAKHVELWRMEPNTEYAQLAASTKKYHVKQQDKSLVDLVTAAARNYTSFTLSNNRGIVQGIGSDSSRTRWALLLNYKQGIPEKWVEESLKCVETTMYSILNQARRREEESSRRETQRALVHKLALSIQQTTKVDEIYNLILDGVEKDLGYECAQLTLVSADNRLIQAIGARGSFTKILEMTVRSIDSSDVLAKVIKNRKGVIIRDCLSKESGCDSEAIKKSGLKSQVVVPLTLGNEAIGALQIGNTHQNDSFSDSDTELLQPLADQAAVAIQMTTEREAFELAREAAGSMMVVVDAMNQIISCNQAYSKVFGKNKGDQACLTSDAPSQDGETLVKLAYKRSKAIQTLSMKDSVMYTVTAASRKDPLGRYGGGVEVLTRTPLHGLTEALSRMLTISKEEELGQAIVDCVSEQLGYSKVMLYRTTLDDKTMTSRWCSGISKRCAQRFKNREIRFLSSENRNPTDGFECLRLGFPLVVIPEKFAAPNCPKGTIYEDLMCRKVLVLPEANCNFARELHITDVHQWLDIPLRTGSMLIGKLSICIKGKRKSFGPDDAGLMTLFSGWAAGALERVIKLHRSETELEVAKEVHRLGNTKGLDALVWTFLLGITLEGGPWFHRAAIFLKHPKSELIQGSLCYGPANDTEWKKHKRTSNRQDNRYQFIEEQCREKLTVPNLRDRRQLEAFQGIAVELDDDENPFTQAFKGRESMLVNDPANQLQEFYNQLQWCSAQKALISPLVYLGECIGLLYVDRPFDGLDVTEADLETVAVVGPQLAMALRSHFLNEQLRNQVLGLTHSGISPLTAIKGLAQSMKQSTRGRGRRLILDLIAAEAQRGADTVRMLLRATELSSHELQPCTKQVDVSDLILERTRSYQLLLESDGCPVSLELPVEPLYTAIDPDLMGDVFAELAGNAFRAIQNHSSDSAKYFGISCRRLDEGSMIKITFENSGQPISAEIKQRMFQQFVSGQSSTGLGLWLVQAVISLHRGVIKYETTRKGHSMFSITLPAGDI